MPQNRVNTAVYRNFYLCKIEYKNSTEDYVDLKTQTVVLLVTLVSTLQFVSSGQLIILVGGHCPSICQHL